jgi:lambda family phage minor tail protein L
MTDLIEVVQKHDPGSALVSLFELNFGGTTLYFHPGLDDESNIYFEDATSPYTIREYQPFPIQMTGIELGADGATNRPSLTVANVTKVFSTALGGITNEDLIGETITIRSTLATHLSATTSGTGTLPIEFPKKKFIIDRLAGETAVSVTFELSSPYDLEGIKIPNRQVIGKYCSWIYQGHANGVGGGCSWRADSINTFADSSSSLSETLDHKMYFTADDIPIVPAADVADTKDATKGKWPDAKGYTVYAANAAVAAGSYYEHPLNGKNTIWKALVAQTANSHVASPQYKSVYWTRGDVCGKKLSSCKCRFQFIPYNDEDTTGSYPINEKNTNAFLPFGSFPGTKKFR